jgi:CTP:molybdopterin cytidylyltransferase MocA
MTLLSAAIVALKPFSDAVIVVVGENAGELAPVIEESGAIMVRNPAPERGQFSSLRIGLEAVLARDYDAVMFTPVDCPPLSLATLRRLREAFERARERGLWAVAPENCGRHGHPLLAARSLIDAFLRAPEQSNAREVKRANAQMFEYVQVSDWFLSLDVNTPSEYAALRAMVPGKRD